MIQFRDRTSLWGLKGDQAKAAGLLGFLPAASPGIAPRRRAGSPFETAWARGSARASMRGSKLNVLLRHVAGALLRLARY
jgi:hypothetical protein